MHEQMLYPRPSAPSIMLGTHAHMLGPNTTFPRPNMHLHYSVASTDELIHELLILNHWLYRYQHMHRNRVLHELSFRNTAVYTETFV